MFKLGPISSPAKCKAWSEKVLSLNACWIQRVKDVDFYTLGAASYLDGNIRESHANPNYTELSASLNPLLLKNFPDLYSCTIDFLQEYLGEPVCLEEKLALPGFHIFGTKPGKNQLPMTKTIANHGGKVHVDLQYENHTSVWNQYQNYNFSTAMTFTLALSLPRTGGGLFYWPNGLTDHNGTKKVHIFQEYKVGSMLVFDGLYPHRMAPARLFASDDYRITLQGHGLFCDESWRIYF